MTLFRICRPWGEKYLRVMLSISDFKDCQKIELCKKLRSKMRQVKPGESWRPTKDSTSNKKYYSQFQWAQPEEVILDEKLKKCSLDLAIRRSWVILVRSWRWKSDYSWRSWDKVKEKVTWTRLSVGNPFINLAMKGIREGSSLRNTELIFLFLDERPLNMFKNWMKEEEH